jgi:hypothetical protein
MSRSFFAFDIDRAGGLQDLELLLVHLQLMRVKRTILRVAIVSLAGLKSDRIVIACDGDKSIELGVRESDGVSVLIDFFGH